MSGCIYCFTIVCCHGRHEKEGWKHRHEELKKGSKRDRIVAEVYDMIILIMRPEHFIMHVWQGEIKFYMGTNI